MKLTHLSAIAAVFALSSTAAFANVKQVKCEGFVIAVSEDIAVAAEEKAGSATEAADNICEAAKQISVSGDDPEVHEIVILPYEIRTTVTIFPTD
ncbi:hypothetical protein CLG85_024270 [Yangia mangrovi]|uniref:Uncharacterized protein n=1 Tax=Alloyangia mangrovi TaxID=1779329 RepID=A0A2A3JUM5_9RHOB|nr:hypothetical protein [Alloyangia mangrovi]MCA0940523.1 hypothetical protein [Alloyangia pacifica]MCA0945885.1 hypothetical protein [Alloyangia pacifica]MCT4373235.1 hypothetical protein [Alloyangia mangrovi]